jgi:hypothetical protein
MQIPIGRVEWSRVCRRWYVFFNRLLSNVSCFAKKRMFDQLKQLFSSSTTSPPSINVVKNRKEISRAVHKAMDSGSVLGIYCPAIAEGMLLVGIEDISHGGLEPILSLRPYDLNGILIQRNQIALSEIRSICVFDSIYENPILRKEPAITN